MYVYCVWVYNGTVINIKSKIHRLEDIDRIRQRMADRKTVLVGGCFDLFHYGHFRFLKKAKELGDFLIVALESDAFIRKTKGREVLHTQKQRSEILAAIEFVDMVIMLPLMKSDTQYLAMVREIRPSAVAVTSGDPQRKNKLRQVTKISGKLKVVTPLLMKFSTQHIIDSFS